MAAVSSIDFTQMKPERKQSQKSDRRNSGTFMRPSVSIIVDEELGQLNEIRGSNDVYNALRPFLIFGKFIGLIPIQGLFQRDVDKLAFNQLSFPAIVSVLLSGIFGVHAVLCFIEILTITAANAENYAWIPEKLLYYSMVLFVYIHFYRHAWDYIKFLRKWVAMTNLTFIKPDATLFRDLNLMALLAMSLITVEIVLDSVSLFRVQSLPQNSPSNRTNEPENESALKNYYTYSHGHVAHLIPYHPLLAIVAMLSNATAGYTWSYMGFTIALISRALYRKFQLLHEQVDELVSGGKRHDASSQWEKFSSDLQALCSGVFEIATLLSPLVFCTFSSYAYIACLNIKEVLVPYPGQTVTASIELVCWAVFAVIRAYIVSICAARINDWSNRLGEIFRKCPIEAYTIEVQRAERLVSGNTIGLHGLGCFVVTKPLMLKLAGVVLTFEIVLLQFSQASSAGSVVCTTS